MAKASVSDVPLLPVGGSSRFRHAYGPRYRVQLSFTPPGRTKQAFKDECDVNVIMRRYQQTGVLPPVDHEPVYADVTGADYQAAQLLIAGAKSRFFGLPAAIRDRFENDPGYFLEFMEDKRNHEEARELGLLPRQDAPGSTQKMGDPPGSPGEPASILGDPGKPGSGGTAPKGANSANSTT